MMWAPIANNVISVAVLGAYLAIYGRAADVCRGGTPASVTDSVLGPFSSGQEALLGLGSTLGIAVQLLVLLPFLRRAGYRYRPRFDFRGSGLGHTLRLGIWTVLFVIVNQVAYTVVVRIASSGTAAAVDSCDQQGATGYTVYSSAFLLVMVPHAIATVSLATAMLPRLSAYAADHDLRGARSRCRLDAAHGLRADRAVRAAAAGGRARRGQPDLRLRSRPRLVRRSSARRCRCSRPAWSSSPATTWCCAASTRSSTRGWCSSSSVSSPRSTSRWPTGSRGASPPARPRRGW